ADITNKILRHVSAAFVEDPVRILRIARFAARFADLGFTIAEETQHLMQQMVNNGEVDALVPERVWQETQRALTEKTPARFFEVLKNCGALEKLFPEIARLWGVPQPEKHHPEIDTGIHTMMVLTQAARLSTDPRVRFAALVHDLGKGITPKDQLPKHIDHESRGVPLVEALCDRYRIPNDYRELAIIVTKYHLHYHRAAELRDDTFLKTLESLDAFRRPERFELFLLACEADSRGRTGYEDQSFAQPDIYRKVFQAANQLNAKELVSKGLKGKAIKEELSKKRITAINEARKIK
ncbi:MAG: HD domain-containing protein, partial [Gammaproteobacteria bacterium]|nr:HD domain-containing protein [Gammaproteobacteria bacterium]